MHGNHGRSQRRGEGAKQDRRDKAKERQAETTSVLATAPVQVISSGVVGASSNAEQRRVAAFEKRAK